MTSRDEWLENRRRGIGASDIAAVLGISQWTTPLELYLDKRGELPPKEEDPVLRRGRRLEPMVLEFYAEETGHAVTRQQDRVIGTEPWMMATLDGFDSTARAPVEAKTVNAFAAQEFGDSWSDEVPLAYAAQCHWQMMLTGADTGYLAALIGSDDFRIFEIRRDKELEQLLVARARDFWKRVTDGTPPEPTSNTDVSLLYRRDKGLTIEAPPHVAELVSELKTIRANVKNADAHAELLAMQIKVHMRDAAVLLGADGKPIATWKSNRESNQIDWEAIAKELKAPAELIAEHTTNRAGNRPLLLK